MKNNSVTLSSMPPEIWGGLECTVNRIGNRYFDQIERTGHAQRIEDLQLIKQLGISTIRYPILWERTWPDAEGSPNWEWADARLGLMRDMGMRPIVGLVHHGSGPRHTNLLDSSFAEGLARYARAVAERYPWVDAYTPVNEPLTTARFSTLYGHWYPHTQDGQAFVRALLNECRATVLAMRAIREVNPRAELVQTEDLAKTYSSKALAYQAEFENERRWLSFDLLMGRVNSEHPMWSYLKSVGISENDIRWFLEHPCPPDILGANYYLTSERFLDERVDLYPTCTHGSNGQHTYADLEAVRIRTEGLSGPKGLLAELWERYHVPVAVTEVHNGCTREEQLRWFVEVWDAAKSLVKEGATIRAVTAWSLFGSYDWDSLLTQDRGHYEPGAFDVRSPAPRPTALAHLISEISGGQEPNHPTIVSPGWWSLDTRLIYGFSMREDMASQSPLSRQASRRKSPKARPILIAGATGTLGRAFARICQGRGIQHMLLSRHQMDICGPSTIDMALDEFKPWAVVNAAGYVQVDEAEHDSEKCFQANTTGPATLADACASLGIQFITFSSDLVFDGSKGSPYVESDQVSPINVYGQSKARAEAMVLNRMPGALVVRTSAFFGPWDEYNFVINTLSMLNSGNVMTASVDCVSPTYIPDLVHNCLDLLIDGQSGIWHQANEGAITWAELARQVAERAGLNSRLVQETSLPSQGISTRRPSYSVLGSERAWIMPSLESALERFFRECEVDWRHQKLGHTLSPSTPTYLSQTPAPAFGHS